MRGSFVFVLGLAACGDGITLPDATMGSDGPARGLVTVHVDGPTGAFDRVFFQNADSTIALATRTNALGDASALMAPGGFVSVIDEDTAIPVIYTWTGVQPGDDLTLDLGGDRLKDVFPNTSVRIDPNEMANNYYLFSRCEQFVDVRLAIESPFAPFFGPCTTTSDLLLLAWGNLGPLGYRYRANVNLVTAAPIDLRGPYLPIDTKVDVIGPSDRSISLRQKIANITYEGNASLSITDTHRVVSTNVPAIAGTTMQTTAQMFDFTIPKEDRPGFTSTLSTTVWGPASAMTTLDLTTPALRDLTTVPAFDLESYTLHWTETAEGSGGDVVWASLGFAEYQWVVIGARGDETALRLPVLPHDTLRPTRETLFLMNFALVSAAGGYDRLRPYLLGHWSPGDWFPMKDPSGYVIYRSRH